VSFLINGILLNGIKAIYSVSSFVEHHHTERHSTQFNYAEVILLLILWNPILLMLSGILQNVVLFYVLRNDILLMRSGILQNVDLFYVLRNDILLMRSGILQNVDLLYVVNVILLNVVLTNIIARHVLYARLSGVETKQSYLATPSALLNCSSSLI
jgi:hypothetical protein